MSSDKGRPLPKFGEWDVNNPASAEGFTVIFNKARDEKKTSTSTSTGLWHHHGGTAEEEEVKEKIPMIILKGISGSAAVEDVEYVFGERCTSLYMKP